MEDIPSVLTDRFADLLARLPGDLDLDVLARTTGAIERPRDLRRGVDLFRLGLAWGPGGFSLQAVAAWANTLGIVRMTDEALIYRLHKAVPFFEAITAALLARASGVASAPGRWPGRVFRIADSSSLSGPASKGTDWRIHAVFDLSRGGFSDLVLTDGHGGEALDRGAPVAGEVRIADRGYANAASWERFFEAAEGQADVIVRMRWNTVRLRDRNGEVFDLIAWLNGLPATTTVHETLAWAQSGGTKKPKLRQIRLVVRRKPDEAIAAAHRHIRQHASRKQSVPDQRSLVAAEFVILATSLSPEEFSAEEILGIYRLRWQIELAFKRLKSLLKIDKIRTRTDAGTRCWLHAHLIMALLCDDVSQEFLESFPSGPG